MAGATISGIFFIDESGDGSDEAADPTPSGVVVNLLNTLGAVVATTTTDGNGAYSFTGVAAGTYRVQFIAPTGDKFSPPGTSTTLANSVVTSAGVSAPITVSGAQSVTGIDAGATTPVSISGTVFSDANDNGLVDGADAGIGGVTVQLLNAQGQPTGVTTTTAANGSYSFTGLQPGTYSVHVVMPNADVGGMFSQLGSNTPPQPTGGTANTASNLLVDGNFSAGSDVTAALAFTGWTLSTNTAATPFGGGPGDGIEIATTNGTIAYALDPKGYTDGYASVMAPDNANPNYSGGSGTHAAFFVDDDAIETLSQTVTLTGGQVYEIGFDLNETTPGAGNPGGFSLSTSIGGQVITTAGSTAGTRLTPGVWTHFADLFTPTSTGSYTLTFTYQSGTPGASLASKDVLVDDVYIVPGQETSNLTTTSEVNSSGTTAPVTLRSGQTVGDESAGIYLPPATIAGTVFADSNGDGVQESTETGLSGRTVNLSTNGTIFATAVTNASGQYSFTSLAAGTYSVTVVAPSGGAFSAAGSSSSLPDSIVNSAGSKTVTVANGATATVNAGIYTPVAISGTVFTDANDVGAKQPGDTGLSGITVKLLASNGTTVVASTTTGGNGAYSFAGLVPGSYTVQIVAPTGDSFSPVGTSTTLLDSTVGSTGQQAETLASGGSASVNAGLVAPSTISGTAFLDSNANGLRDAGEAGLSGVIVKLVSASGTVLATGTTSATGGYSFTAVMPGTDTVQFTAPAGYQFSTASTDTVTVTSGSSGTENAGLFEQTSVTGIVFTDSNADGVQEAGETGLAGVTVNLLSSGGSVIATTTTGSNGSYSFTGMTPGSDTIQIVAPTGDQFSTASTDAVTLASGGSASFNAGVYAPASVSGVVFLDSNADGTQQTGESGLAGVTVKLVASTGSILATTTTGTGGSYSFTGVTPGTDTVSFTAPSGDSFSTASSGTATLVSGGTATANAGLFVPATVTGTVFTDSNADGVQNTGELGLAGVTVNLLASNGSVLATTTTGANGGYSFTGVTPGSDTIQIVAPAGDRFSTASTDAVTLASGSTASFNAGVFAPGSVTGEVYLVSNAGTQQTVEGGLAGVTVKLVSATGSLLATTTTGTGGTYSFTGVTPGTDTVVFTAPAGDSFATASTDSVTITSGSTATAFASVYTQATVTGTVFTDTNADGVQNTGELGLAGVTVNLLASNGSVLATTTTGANGGYSFTGVTPGSDTIQIVAPAGDQLSTAGTDAVTLVGGGTAGFNAGVFMPGSISGTVFLDSNADGTRQTGEAGLAGVTVKLVSSTGSLLATTSTGSGGSYSFTGITPGTDTVSFTAPAGDRFSTPSSDVVTIVSGSTGTANAGVYAPASVTGTVFADSNADGVQQSSEAGLSGVTVNLLAANGSVIATTTTGSNGNYSFTGVTPGSDTIQIVAPTGDLFSATGTDAVTLVSGSAASFNTGLYAPGSIAGVVYVDSNADGTQQTGEAGLAGVTVKLVSATGSLLATTTTGSGGSYSFAGVTPGTDTVSFTAPAGDRFSTPSSDAVTIVSGGTGSASAGVYAPATVTGVAFTDSNADGLQEAGEAGQSGVTVQLLSASGSLIATTSTGPTGAYSFTGVTPNTDTVAFTAPSGERFSTPASDNVTLRSASTASANAGLYKPASVTGTVFTDGNADGVQDNGDQGLAGITVNLLAANGSVIATTTTGANGSYSFTGVTPGSDTIQIVTPAGDHLSTAGTDAVTLVSGGSASFTTGLWAPASISGVAFADSNADGVQEAGEAGLGGITVKLVSSTGAVLATTTTAANGSYSFTGVTPGTDSVQFTTPSGELFSSPGSSTALPDSTVSIAGAEQVTATSGSATTVNAGIYQSGSISGLVFLDGMASGTYHVGDPGVAGVTVMLLTASGHPTGTTTTNSAGQYSFTNLAVGSYQVQVMAPAGLSFTTEHASGNPLLDSDVAPTTGLTQTLTVLPGQTNAAANAGMIINGSFAGTRPVALASGVAYAANATGGVVTGTGNDNVHTGTSGNNVVALSGTNNIVEAGASAVTDIVTSQGALNAQTQNDAVGFLFAGTGNSTLQGGQGNAWLMGGTGRNMVAGASGSNVLIGGVSGGSVAVSGTSATNFTVGSEIRLAGQENEVLYQKGDGVQQLDGTFNPAVDSLLIYGYSSGTIETVNGRTVLYLGGQDMIVFNGGNPFSNGTYSSLSGVTFNASITAAPLASLVVPASGLPQIVATSGSLFPTGGKTVSTPIPSPTPAPTPAPLPAPTPAPTSTGQTITMSGYNQSLNIGNANTTVSGSQGQATIIAGSGNDSITAQGYNNTITAGSGNDTIVAGQGNETVTVGAGNDSITAQGYSNVITIAGGTDTVVAGAGNDTVSTGSSSSIVTLSGSSNLVSAGPGFVQVSGGSNNTYHVNALGTQGGIDVLDFSVNNGDVLSLGSLLAQSSWNKATATLGNYLSVTETGTTTTVAIDTSGSGTHFLTAATLHGAGAANLLGLQAHNAINLFS